MGIYLWILCSFVCFQGLTLLEDTFTSLKKIFKQTMSSSPIGICSNCCAWINLLITIKVGDAALPWDWVTMLGQSKGARAWIWPLTQQILWPDSSEWGLCRLSWNLGHLLKGSWGNRKDMTLGGNRGPKLQEKFGGKAHRSVLNQLSIKESRKWGEVRRKLRRMQSKRSGFAILSQRSVSGVWPHSKCW